MVKLTIVSEQQMWDSYSPSQKMTGLPVKHMNKMNPLDLFAMLPFELREKIADSHEDVSERERLEKHKTYGDLEQEKRLWVLVKKTSKKDLKALCRRYGIKGHSGLNNSQLAEMVAVWEVLGFKAPPLKWYRGEEARSQDHFNLIQRLRCYFDVWGDIRRGDGERWKNEIYIEGTHSWYATPHYIAGTCPTAVVTWRYTGSKLWDGKPW